MNSFLETLRKLGPARLGIMGIILMGLVVFFIFISLRISKPEMRLLYDDLANNDASTIAATLEENQIEYEISPDGTRVMVPEDHVGRARMLLAQSGLPNGGGMGYEVFDQQSGFGTTSFVQNINQVRALEGELARTISSLESVRNTRVHLVLPQRELFSRETRPSSASVFLGVRPGARVSEEQIASIQSLVASAVPDLKTSDVSIIDNEGNLLARGGEEGASLLSLKTEEMRRDFESRLAKKIEGQVSRIVGFGNVRATVTAEMNFDRISTNEELYDPETQVIRSSQLIEETSTEREPPAEDISVENNLPGLDAELLDQNSPSAQSSRIEEVTNYEISKTIRNVVREVGEIQKLSIAVLVDGRYTDTPEGEEVYQPRSAEEMERITSLVRSAVGYDESRGDMIEVVNLQFADIETTSEFEDQRMLFGFEKSHLLDLVEILTVSIMIVLVVLLVLQPMVNRLLAAQSEAAEKPEDTGLLSQETKPALAAPSEAGQALQSSEMSEDTMVNIEGVEGKVKASTMRKVEEIVENYPNETVSVIRSWMTQES